MIYNINCNIYIKNLPDEINGEFIVAKVVDSELWYDSNWKSLKKAREVAFELSMGYGNESAFAFRML